MLGAAYLERHFNLDTKDARVRDIIYRFSEVCGTEGMSVDYPEVYMLANSTYMYDDASEKMKSDRNMC